MHLDVGVSVDANPLPSIVSVARAAEELGFAGLWTPETSHNAFLPLVLAAEHTQRLQIGAAVAIAFPRSPMVMAQIAWDLAAYAQGRFLLGLGTQVKAHIERRFSTTWDAPVPRLREYIQSLRAIWDCWQNGTKLDLRGQFYQHTLMTPFFSPPPIEHPVIPIYIAGVNARLAQLAGEVCDGFHVHPLNSVKYLQEILKPQIASGAERSSRSPAAVTLAGSVFVITGRNEAATEVLRHKVRTQIAFYASTPTYRTVLACHGWERIGEKLSRLAATKHWDELPALISDEMLHTFAVEAPPDQLGQALRDRYTGLLDRIALYLPFVPGQDDAMWRTVIAQVQGGGVGARR